MELTNRLRRRFIKDCSLPIPLTDEPYFSYFMDLYDNAFDTKKKLADFMEIVSQFNTEEEVLDYIKSITDLIISSIKTNPIYNRLINESMQTYMIPKHSYPTSSIFKEYNTGKQMVSMDLKKANFSALNYFNPEILNSNSYYEFIKKYTNHEYIAKSKYIRQIIFGNLSTRIGTIEKFMTYQIVKELENKGLNIILFMNDEVVFDGNPEIYDICVEISKNLPFKVDVELFVLKQLRNESGQPFKSDKFFIKKFISHTDEKRLPFEIKATDSTFYSQFYKLLIGEEIVDNDLIFIHEGFLASYKEIISGEIK